jgi:hypothetical protein
VADHRGSERNRHPEEDARDTHRRRLGPAGTNARTAATAVTVMAMGCPEGNNAPVVATSEPLGV